MMTFVESNTTTLGLGISYDSDGLNVSPSIHSNSGSVESIFSDVPLSSSASEADSLLTLADSSDEDNFTVYSDEELNISYVDRSEQANEQIQVADFLPWPSGNARIAPAQPIRGASLESTYPDAFEDAEGYESDADDQLDEMLWRRGRAKRRRANRARVNYLIEHHEPVFQMDPPLTSTEPAVHTAAMASRDLDPSSMPTNPGHSFDSEEPAQHWTVTYEQPVDEQVHDIGMQDYVPGETEISQLMGQMEIPSESEYEEFYSSDEKHPRPQRVHYTSERLELTFVELPPMTEEQVDELRRGFALGLPMEDIMPIVYHTTRINTHDETILEVMPSPDNACPSEGLQNNTTSSDSMETIDLNTTSDEDRAEYTADAEDVDPETSADVSSSRFSVPRVQLGPFCVVEGPVLPFATAPCTTPAIPTYPTRELFTLGREYAAL